MGIKAEDDLFKLAAQAGKEGSPEAKDGISLDPIFLGPEAGGVNRPNINQKGDDPGFETRVKTPGRRATKSDDKPAPKRPRGSAQERTIEEVAEAVENKFNQFGMYLTLGLPVTGTYMVERSPEAVKALISIGKRRPKVMQMLYRFADGADGIDIAQYIAGIAVAVQVDMGRVPADMILARATGVTAVVEKYFMQEEEPQNANVTQQPTVGRFQTIS